MKGGLDWLSISSLLGPLPVVCKLGWQGRGIWALVPVGDAGGLWIILAES